MKTNQIKLLSAGIGAGAVIAMGGLGVAFSDVSTAQPEPAPPGRVQPTEITTGETSKQCAMTSESRRRPRPRQPLRSRQWNARPRLNRLCQ